MFWFGPVIRGYLDFKVLGTDTNRSRWPTCDWWVDFLDSLRDRLYDAIERVIAEIEARKAWVDQQVGPTLAAIALVDVEWFDQQLAEWVPRISRPLQVCVERANGLA